MTPEEIKLEHKRRRRLARFRFKTLIHKVIINQSWLAELEETKLGENVKRNVQIIVRRKGVKGLLSLSDKRILNTPPEERTVAERKQILFVVTNLKCFKRYPPRVRGRLAKDAYYMYFNRGRTVVKQGHRASAVYFILDGEITVFQSKWSVNENKFVDVAVGAMGPGDMFGEVALLYDTKRKATCQTATDVELLCVFRDTFDIVLKDILKTQWDQILFALNRFEYFKLWTEDQVRECCVLSRIKQFNPQQIIYSEDKGVLNYVHFVLSGQCMILQCLKMNVEIVNSKKRYSLFDLSEEKSQNENHKLKSESKELDKEDPEKRLRNISIGEIDNLPTEIIENVSHYNNQVADHTTFVKNTEKTHKIEHRFVDVATLSCGSVFALGENIEHRTVLARNQVQCLLIPRYWLFQKSQNIGNIWHRTKMYLDASIPSRDALFVDFIKTVSWIKFRKEVVKEIVSRKENKNPTRVRDVPIICRIEEDL